MPAEPRIRRILRILFFLIRGIHWIRGDSCGGTLGWDGSEPRRGEAAVALAPSGAAGRRLAMVVVIDPGEAVG